ncbi:hypothetical protein [Streptomyces shenzhenensis]|uniref:hypothetical protein n=1 Tax=Streptomyces shenzhenensis TaxID=943815 RepID=UPI0033F7638F
MAYLAAHHRIGEAEARSMEEWFARLTAREGVLFTGDRVAADSGDMLRLVHLSERHGLARGCMRAMKAEVFTGIAKRSRPRPSSARAFPKTRSAMSSRVTASRTRSQSWTTGPGCPASSA